MIRDGGFKVRTDLFADKVGKTDDWLAAINLSTTIPSAINPLSILPVKIPLKVFLDIGTYAEAWKKMRNLIVLFLMLVCRFPYLQKQLIFISRLFTADL